MNATARSLDLTQSADLILSCSSNSASRPIHRIAITTTFFINGFVLASWVPHIPAIKAYHGLSDGMLGMVLLAMPAGSLAALSFSGRLIDRLGSRAMTSIAAVALCLALPLPILAPAIAALPIALAIFGACNGALDVSMNSQAIAVEKDYARPIMSSFHACFSFGGLSGAAVTGVAIKWGLQPGLHVVVTALIAVTVTLVASRWLAPSAAHEIQRRVSRPAPTHALMILGVLAFLGLIAEGSMSDWSAVYLHDVLGSSATLGAAGFAVFSMLMAFGRVAGDSIVSRIGHARALRLSGLSAAAGLALALLIDVPLVSIAGMGIMGFGIANIIPIVFGAAGTKGLGSTGTAVATVASIGYFGFLAGPPVIGLAAEVVGLRIALGVVCAACVIVGIMAREAA